MRIDYRQNTERH